MSTAFGIPYLYLPSNVLELLELPPPELYPWLTDKIYLQSNCSLSSFVHASKCHQVFCFLIYMSIPRAYLCANLLRSCLILQPYGLWPTRLLCPWDSPGNNIGVGCHVLLQGIFPTQGSNPSVFCLLHWQLGSLPLVPPEKPWVFHFSV